jgi:hypothetical protein
MTQREEMHDDLTTVMVAAIKNGPYCAPEIDAFLDKWTPEVVEARALAREVGGTATRVPKENP